MPEELNRLTRQQSHITTYYSEQETAQYSRLELQFIHQLAETGVISGISVVGDEQRRYSPADLVLFRRVRRLSQDLGINLEGIEIILRLTARVEMLQRELARYQGIANQQAEVQQASVDDSRVDDSRQE